MIESLAALYQLYIVSYLMNSKMSFSLCSVSDRVVPLRLCWSDGGPEREVVLSSVHGRHEEERQPPQINLSLWDVSAQVVVVRLRLQCRGREVRGQQAARQQQVFKKIKYFINGHGLKPQGEKASEF